MGKVAQAVVLAAGRGERLHPLTTLRPKVMLPIANKPILQYVLEALAANGVQDILIVVGYGKEQVQDTFGSGENFGVHIRYFVQAQQLGTASALAAVRGHTQKRFLLLSGDTMIAPETIQPLLEAEGDSILVTEQGSPDLYGLVVARDGRVVQILEKPGVQVSHWVNTGNYLLHDHVFPYLEEEVDLTTSLQHLVEDGRTLQMCTTDAMWLDANYPWDLLRLNSAALGKITLSVKGECEEGVVIKGPVQVGNGSIIRAHSYLVGPVVIGSGTEIGPYVCVFPGSSIGDNVVVAPFTQIRNSIIDDSVHIGPHSGLTNGIIAEGCTFSSGFHARGGPLSRPVNGSQIEVQAGAVIAEYVEAGHDVVLKPGVLIGKGAKISDCKLIADDIPEDALVL